MKVIKDNEELKSYIKDGDIVFDCSIECHFNIEVLANIKAWNIDALDIKAWDIKAWDIKAWDIKAENIDASNINAWNIKALNIDALNIKALDISFYSFCISSVSILCKSITGRRGNSIFKCLDNDIVYKEQTKSIVIDGNTINLSLESFNALKKSLC